MMKHRSGRRDHRRFNARQETGEGEEEGDNPNLAPMGRRKAVVVEAPPPPPPPSRTVQKTQHVAPPAAPSKIEPINTPSSSRQFLNAQESSDEGAMEEGGEDASDDEDEEDDDSNALLNRDMSTVPLQELLALRERLGPKLYEKAVFRSRQREARESGQKLPMHLISKSNRVKRQFKRTSHKRPREMSSKSKPTEGPRDIFGDDGPTKIVRSSYSNPIHPDDQVHRDPRFDERCGEFKSHLFTENYAWMEDVRKREMDELKRELRAATRDDKAEQDYDRVELLRMTIKQMKDAERNIVEDDKAREGVRVLRRENMTRMRSGLAPVYVTKGEVRERNMKAKYDDLKAGGQLNKYMRKKEKKMKGKAHKFGGEAMGTPMRLRGEE